MDAGRRSFVSIYFLIHRIVNIPSVPALVQQTAKHWLGFQILSPLPTLSIQLQKSVQIITPRRYSAVSCQFRSKKLTLTNSVPALLVNLQVVRGCFSIASSSNVRQSRSSLSIHLYSVSLNLAQFLRYLEQSIFTKSLTLSTIYRAISILSNRTCISCKLKWVRLDRLLKSTIFNRMKWLQAIWSQ